MSFFRCANTFPLYIQRRFRVKTKWASTQPKKTSCDLALEYFDLYYKPIFDQRWPSIRLALLSQPKYCALINNFASDRDMIQLDLSELGAYDIIREGREFETSVVVAHEEQQKDFLSKMKITSPTTQCSNNDYMPVRKVISEKERMKLKEAEQSVYHANEDVKLDSPKIPLRVPYDLAAFAQHVGDVSTFPPAKRDNSNKLGYYLMDGASLLPVLALDLEPGCRVLDLCAAPGGKSLAILQTLLPDHLTCVDRSYSRLQRLKDVMRLYLPKSYMDEGKVQCLHYNAVEFCKTVIVDNNLYDRVLVDVPCFADRHVLTDEDNNLFRSSRLGERLQLQDLQKDLLLSRASMGKVRADVKVLSKTDHISGAIQCCRPGGVIVYSTCTLAPTQNDGVISATLERIWQETKLGVIVESVGEITDRFSQTFTFHSGGMAGSRYGCLVLPKLTDNFGPMYFCRLRRTN